MIYYTFSNLRQRIVVEIPDNCKDALIICVAVFKQTRWYTNDPAHWTVEGPNYRREKPGEILISFEEWSSWIME